MFNLPRFKFPWGRGPPISLPRPMGLPIESDADLLLDLWKDECDAVRKYHRYSEITSDSKLKSLFLRIATEEEHHRDELARELEEIKRWGKKY